MSHCLPQLPSAEQIVRSLRTLDDPPPVAVGASAPTSDFDLNPDARDNGNKSRLMPAAVLVPLVQRPDTLTVLLTQRTAHLNDHAGQVSFPGGRVEKGDAGPVATALRETEEEIGLDRGFVKVVGFLDAYETVTRFVVTPVVGLVVPKFSLRLDPFEVADVFEVPLAFFLDPRNHQRRSRQFAGVERAYYVFDYEDRVIWGATAGMLVGLSRRICGDHRA